MFKFFEALIINTYDKYLKKKLNKLTNNVLSSCMQRNSFCQPL